MRAALDGLIWDTITYTQGSEPDPDAKGLSRLEFPLAPKWNATGIEKNRFHGFPFPQNLIDWMKTIQPGTAEKPSGHPDRGLKVTLEDIHNLARFDRHRRLRVVGVVPSVAGLKIKSKPPGGIIVGHNWLDGDLLNSKFDFVRLKVICPGGLIPYHLRFETNMTFEVAVEDIELYDGEDVSIQLTRFEQAVELVIERFAFEFS